MTLADHDMRDKAGLEPRQPEAQKTANRAPSEAVGAGVECKPLLTAQMKADIADNITIECRSKTDVVQDVWDELVSRGMVKAIPSTRGR